MTLELFEFKPELAKEWDDFVIHSPYGSVHQISAWKNFQEKIPGREKVVGWGVRDSQDKKIIATTFCVQMDTGFMGKKWWYSARGPVFDPEKNSEAGKVLITHVSEKLKKLGGIFWRFDPYFSKTEIEKLTLKTHSATQNYQPTDTLELDLTKSDIKLLEEMKRKGRYNISLSEKKGVTFRTVENGKFSAQSLDDFWKLNHETTTRDTFSGHEKSYYEKFLREMKDYAVLFFAEYEGKRIAAAISTFCGDKAIYYFGASTSDENYRNLMAPYGLQWHMIQYAKKKNCKTYDFLGIAPENEPKHAYAGISEFKWKFGGARKTYAPGREIAFDKLWYGLYRMAKILKRR